MNTENEGISKRELSKKKKKKARPNALEKYSEISWRLVLGPGSTDSLVTFAKMTSVKPDCLTWLRGKQLKTMDFNFFFPKILLRKKERKIRIGIGG